MVPYYEFQMVSALVWNSAEELGTELSAAIDGLEDEAELYSSLTKFFSDRVEKHRKGKSPPGRTMVDAEDATTNKPEELEAMLMEFGRTLGVAEDVWRMRLNDFLPHAKSLAKVMGA